MQAQRKTFTGINAPPRRDSKPSWQGFENLPVRSCQTEIAPPPEVVSMKPGFVITLVAVLLGIIGVLAFVLFA